MESKLAYEDGVVVSDRTVRSRTRATARIDRRQASHERETVTSVVIDLSLPIDAPALSETVMEQMRLAAEKFPAIFLTAREKRFEERLRHLSEAYAETDALDEAYLRIHERELQARQALIKDTEMLDAKAVHRHAGHKTTNPSQTAGRWRQAGRIFSVPVGGVDHYPKYQFEGGEPKEAVAQVLEHLSPKDPAARTDPEREPPFSDWAIAFWFAAANAWLDDQRPLDLLDKNPEAVVLAASHARDRISD
jgi:hypothetical protein